MVRVSSKRQGINQLSHIDYLHVAVFTVTCSEKIVGRSGITFPLFCSEMHI